MYTELDKIIKKLFSITHLYCVISPHMCGIIVVPIHNLNTSKSQVCVENIYVKTYKYKQGKGGSIR